MDSKAIEILLVEDNPGDARLTLVFAGADGALGALTGLRMSPMQIRRFCLRRASREDTAWLRDLLDRESRAFGVRVRAGDDGMLAVECAPFQDALDRLRHVEVRAAKRSKEGHNPVGEEPEHEIRRVVPREVIPDEQHADRRQVLGEGNPDR